MFKRQDGLQKDIAGFDIDQLKPTEVLEKLSLPTQEDTEFEKNIIEEETAANEETFSKDVAAKLEVFDSNILKYVEKAKKPLKSRKFQELKQVQVSYKF